MHSLTIHGEGQEESIPIFQRIADKVSSGMGTPVNIAVWILLVVVWTVLFSTQLVPANGSFLPSWFTSTGYNFPLNLVTKIAELYIGSPMGAFGEPLRAQPRSHSCSDRLTGNADSAC